MKNTNNKELARLLEGIDQNEIRHLYKRAALLRRGARARVQATDDEEEQVVRYRKPKSLDDVVLELLKAPPESAGKPIATRQGLVTSLAKKLCHVRFGEHEEACLLSPEIARTQQTSVAVGDEVLAITRSAASDPIVEQVLPRRTVLSRPDPGNPHLERAVVANVDTVVIVVSLMSPPLHPRLIDRYLIAIQRGGARPVVAVNKLDLATDLDREIELAKLDPYRTAGIQIIHCSAGTGEGIDELRSSLAGQMCAFVGHSGVGKSSLLNALCPELGLQEGEVSLGYGRGTHTTTASHLYELGEGTRLIDTPGIRSFGLPPMAPRELLVYFQEFEEHAAECKFRDCSHTHEPRCGVKQAVHEGLVSSHRYDTYTRLLADE